VPLVTVRTPEGKATQVDEADLPAYEAAGFTVETGQQATERTAAVAAEEQYGGLGGQIEAGVLGTARGATFGLSDVALRAGGADPVALQKIREVNPVTSVTTEIFGGVAPTLLSGGTGAAGSLARLTPAGAAGRVALGTTERLAGAAPSAARYAAAAATGGAVEGAAQNLGSYVSDVALKNKELSAEGAIGALGSGGLWGFAAGGAFAGIERGTIAARRLFPRSEAGEQVVELAEREFVSAADDAVRAGDELAKTARQRLDDIDLRRAELNLEKLKLKGQTDPAAAERLAQIKVEQAKVKITRREASAEIAAQRAAKGQVAPQEVAPLAPDADGIVATADDVAAATAPVLTPDVVPSLAGADDLMTRLGATKGLLDEGVPLADIGAAARQESVLDDAIRQADAEHARLTTKLERFQQGRPMADDFMARYGAGAKSKYSATGEGGTRGGGAGPRRTDRTRLLPDEEVEASINDRVFAGIGDARVAREMPVDRVPEGFDASLRADGARLFEVDAPAVRGGIPSHADASDYRSTVHVVRPSELAEVPLFGTDVTGKRVSSIKGAWDSGKRVPVIEIDVTPTGRYSVADGNHRLLAAAADDRPVAVRFRPVDTENVVEHADDISARMRDAGGGARQSSISGADLDSAYDDAIERAAAAPNRRSQERILREAADLEDQIFDTVAARGGRDADDVAKIRTKRGDLGQDSYTVAVRRAEKRAMAEEGSTVTAKTAAERADLEQFDRGLRQQQFAGGKTAGQAADELRGMPLADQILGPAPKAAAPVQQAGPGKFIDDADEAIRVVGEMEKATAELAQELGDAAPPKAKALADGYMAAVDDQARKSAEKIATTVDDSLRASSVVTLPKAPKAPASEARRIGRTVADAAAVLDTIQTLGDIPGVPNPRDIPVIGPVLSMYLKFRAGKMALKRIGGRIPATAESKLAAKSAELRDRAAVVVDKILLGASKTAKAARRPVVVTGAKLLDTLEGQLYPHDDRKRDRPKTAVEATKARVDELAAATADPEAVRAAVRRSVPASDPDLLKAIESATLRKLAYLHKHAPKAPPPGLLGARPWTPSKVEIEKFARRVRAAEDPVSVLDELEAGTLTPEAADTLRSVYPTLFSDVQMRLISRAAELEADVPYKRRLTISALLDVPLDDSLRPENLAYLQGIYTSGGASPDAAGAAPGGQQPPAPAVAAPVSVSRLYETPDQRRASRR